jgi:hypothetical protein
MYRCLLNHGRLLQDAKLFQSKLGGIDGSGELGGLLINTVMDKKIATPTKKLEKQERKNSEGGGKAETDEKSNSANAEIKADENNGEVEKNDEGKKEKAESKESGAEVTQKA